MRSEFLGDYSSADEQEMMDSTGGNKKAKPSPRLPDTVKRWIYQHSVKNVKDASQLGFDKGAPGKFLFKDRGELYDKIIIEGGGQWGFRDNKTPCWHPAIDIDCKLKEGEDASVHQQKLLIRDRVLADNCEIVHRVFDWFFPDAELHVIVDLKENLLGAHIIALGINISDGNVDKTLPHF
jgi:hypothetical protein